MYQVCNAARNGVKAGDAALMKEGKPRKRHSLPHWEASGACYPPLTRHCLSGERGGPRGGEKDVQSHWQQIPPSAVVAA
jgi:hypothetical protein